MDASEFSCQVKTVDDGLVITIAGVISERSTFPENPVQSPTSIWIDTSGVTRINSLGVSAWIHYMNTVCAGDTQVIFRPLSVALVSQTSMVSNFLGSASVDTFLAPYFCPDCEHVCEQAYGFSDNVPESIACPKCQTAMEFDDDLNAYLSWRTIGVA